MRKTVSIDHWPLHMHTFIPTQMNRYTYTCEHKHTDILIYLSTHTFIPTHTNTTHTHPNSI